MKKLMALLLAVSTMAMSTSALAFSVSPIGDGKGASRNYVDGTVRYGSNAFVEGTVKDTTYLPTYRKGDEITFAISGEGVTDGAVLTFICSTQADTPTYTNGTVQMVDQVELSVTDGVAYCTYKLRNTLDDGRYMLEMRLGENKQTFSFLIGTPSVELLYVKAESDRTGTKADKYLLKNGNAYCFGKLSVTGGANLTQTDTDFGFVLNGTSFIKATNLKSGETAAQAVADASVGNNNSEIYGTGNYFYRMMITGVAADVDVNTLPDVDVYLND
ncbi:MAG: hypothetical protein IKY39_01810 [Clostridia bacterium]|nr:hypothetical protein [Clostridia bacterium]